MTSLDLEFFLVLSGTATIANIINLCFVTLYDLVGGWEKRLCKKPAWCQKFLLLKPLLFFDFSVTAQILNPLQPCFCRFVSVVKANQGEIVSSAPTTV